MSTLILKNQFGKVYTINNNNEIHRGGEGRIITLDNEPNRVAKIYHDSITPISEQQFQFLSQLNSSIFVVPLELLLKDNNIVGYIMEYLGIDYFPLSSLFQNTFCNRNNITTVLKQEIAQKIIEGVELAHKQNVVVGDLNQYNILVNNSGSVKFIDTDSYQTPAHAHSGMLLNDIRDFLYNGFVSLNSDFFALSVLIFYTYTYTHPFKGIHKIFKAIEDRMIQKIPVFANDPDLILPKCYQPIQQPELQQQFDMLYLEGKRFLISLFGAKPMVAAQKPVLKTVLKEKDLTIKIIVNQTNVRDIVFNKQLGYIETDDIFVIYDASNKGYLTELFQIQKSKWQQVFLGQKQVFCRSGNSLYLHKSAAEIVKLDNVELQTNSRIQIYESILLVITDNVMTWIYLDEQRNKAVKLKRTDVFGASFRFYNGLIQNAGGINRIFYNTGIDIANVKLEKNVKDLYQQNNVGIVQYIENKVVMNRYFLINGLQLNMAKWDSERMPLFAFMPTDKTNGFIFEPADNQINIIRTQDFQIISTMECSFASAVSKLQYAQAGIVLWQDDKVLLLNKES